MLILNKNFSIIFNDGLKKLHFIIGWSQEHSSKVEFKMAIVIMFNNFVVQFDLKIFSDSEWVKCYVIHQQNLEDILEPIRISAQLKYVSKLV